jgi:hypothetical protein
MHGPLKAAYQLRSNGKDVAGQVCRVQLLYLQILLNTLKYVDSACRPSPPCLEAYPHVYGPHPSPRIKCGGQT